MQSPPELASSTEKERLRLEALYDYQILDTPDEEEFDQLVKLASTLFEVPGAMITFVGRDRQFFKSRVGMEMRLADRQTSFCTHTVMSEKVMLVLDVAQDPRFANGPHVCGDPAIRFYAGAPLITPQGHAIGAFCLIDHTPHSDFGERDRTLLQNLADITMQRVERRRVAIERQARVVQFQHIAQTSPDGILCVDHTGSITFWNPACEKIFGYSEAEVMGQHFAMLVPPDQRATRIETMRQVLQDDAPIRLRPTIEELGLRRDGTTFLLEHSPSTWQERGQPTFGVIIRDITERKASEERLYRLAHLDPLTNLANRQTFTEQLREALERGERIALMLFDLDDFKDVNDAHGHHAGDQVLRSVAARLVTACGSRALVARLGGDEFAVLLHDDLTRKTLDALGRRAIAAIGQPIEWEHQWLQVGASIGVALAPDHGSDSELLLANVDLALYSAKRAGRNSVRFFVDELRQALVTRRRLEDELHEAFIERQFELHYQPQFHLRTHRMVGAEALLRWRHPERGLLQPAEFLPVLEASSLAGPVGEWILREACEQAARWQTCDTERFRMSVNLFPSQVLSPTLDILVFGTLAATGLPTSSLELELTETTLLRPQSELYGTLKRLHDAGVSIAFDDYGTGYASFSLLKRLPISRLKIDRTFVADAVQNPEDAAVIQAILYLGSNFDLCIIAEGIETPEQEALLREMGCDEGQGYLYSAPLEPTAFAERFIKPRTARLG